MYEVGCSTPALPGDRKGVAGCSGTLPCSRCVFLLHKARKLRTYTNLDQSSRNLESFDDELSELLRGAWSAQTPRLMLV